MPEGRVVPSYPSAGARHQPNAFRHSSLSALLFLRFFAEYHAELGFAGFHRVVEGGAFAIGGTVAIIGAEEKAALLGAFREADEAGFAFSVGANVEVELVQVLEAIAHANADFGAVDGLAGIVVDDEIGGAGTDASVDFGDGFGVGGGRVRLRRCFGGAWK